MKLFSKVLVILSLAFILSGCDNSSVKMCVKEPNDKEEFKTESTYIIYYDENDTVVKVTKKDVIETDKNMIDFNIENEKKIIEKYEGIKGVKFTVKKISDTTIQKVLTINYKKLNKDQLKEHQLDSNALYSDKLTLKKFEHYFLDDYTCDNENSDLNN